MTEEPTSEDPTWLDIELTDARSGESFTLASLGEVVAIEPMAIWCTNCRAQMHNVVAAHGSADFLLPGPDGAPVELRCRYRALGD